MTGRSELPSGWSETTLGSAVDIEMGQSPPGRATNDIGEGLPLLGGAADFTETGLDASRYTREPKKTCEPGDLIICIRATIGKPRIADQMFCLGRGVAGLRPGRAVSLGWLQNYLTHSEPRFLELGTGSTFKQISKKILESFPLPTPPLNEQRRIVAKIEELTARSRNAKQALDAIPPLLERFRQSVLAAAFRGDLTKQWRQQNPHTEPASELLKRIRQERRHRWEQDYLQTQKAKGKEPKNDKWKAKYQEPEPVDTTDLPELPEGWCWARVGELCHESIQTGPFGALLHRSEYTTSGVPVVAIGNVKWGYLDLEEVDHVPPEKAEELSKFHIREGDVLFTRSGTVGRSAIVPPRADGFVMSSHILRIRQDRSFYHPELMFRAFRGEPTIKEQLRQLTRGATRPGFNTELLSQMLIPVPPRQEQDFLVQALGEFDTKIKFFAEASSLSRKLDRLGQSILAKAFRGELVPQDPNDEPASALLERICAKSN